MDIEALKAMVEAAISGASILGGAMAYQTGWAAMRSFLRGASPEAISREIDLGVAQGFLWEVLCLHSWLS
jgi:hypothetical protein